MIVIAEIKVTDIERPITTYYKNCCLVKVKKK